ncbi:MAG TPA: hypothetical protein ENJ60_14210 [Aeromonadales bacterium]|nr:hypothetical protein [Aeromonadales bacterium]
MHFSTILFPVLIQITLTLLVFLILGARKIKAIKAGGVDRQKTALDNSAWPEDVVKVSNNIANQFQTPVLFYVLSMLFYFTQQVSTTVLILAWVYALSRLAHAYVHIHSNYVPLRFNIFTLGVLCLIVMTVLAFLKLPLL